MTRARVERSATALVVTCAALLALVLAAPRAEATFPGENGKIVFSTDRNGNFQIYTMNPSGSEQRRLTVNVANDSSPAWSPDGAKIAFASDRDGNEEIYKMNPDSSAQARLTYASGSRDFSPAWAPDGSKLVFVRHEAAASFCGGDSGQSIYTMNADGTNQSRLSTGCSFDGDPVWSPNGSRIAFVSRTGPGTEQDLFTIGADGADKTRLTFDGVAKSVPDWSPDSTRIVFDRAGEVWVVNSDGSGERRLVGSGDFSPFPFWSPDSQRIAFVGTSFDGEALFTINPDGGDTALLTSDFPASVAPDWQPLNNVGPPTSTAFSPQVTNSQTIPIQYTASPTVTSVELWAREPGASSFELVATDHSPDTPSFSFEASVDGSYNFYTRAHDSLGVYEAAPAGAGTDTFLDTAAPSSFGSAPASSEAPFSIHVDYSLSDPPPSFTLERIELYAQAPGETGYEKVQTISLPAASGSFVQDVPPREGIHRFYTVGVDLAGNVESAPTDADAEVRLIDPGPPAEGLIAFASDRDGNSEIYTAYSDGSGWEDRLTDNPAFDGRPAWSPSGSSIAFASNRGGNLDIYVMNADGSGVTRLTTDPAGDSHPAWSPDGRIAFTSSRDGHGEIYVMQADGSGQRRITHSPTYRGPEGSREQGSSWDPSWSPDGTRIVFVTHRAREVDWLQIIRADGTDDQRFWGAFESGPDWSLDGRIASSTGGGESPDIYYLNPDRTGYTVVTDNDNRDKWPSWSPDSSALAFVRTREPGGGFDDGAEIVRIRDDGEGLQRLTHNPASDFDPDWQPRLYRSAQRFCDAQRAQIGAAAFARLYGAGGGKGKKRSGENACQAAHRPLGSGR